MLTAYDFNCNQIKYLANNGIACTDRRPRIDRNVSKVFKAKFESVAGQLSKQYTKIIGEETGLELISVDAVSFYDFIMSISRPTSIQQFKIPRIPELGIFEINSSTLRYLSFYEKRNKLPESERESFEMFREEKLEKSFDVKPLDQDEFATATDLFKVTMPIITKTFNPLHNIQFKTDEYLTNPNVVIYSNFSEHILLISLEIRLCNCSGLISICLSNRLAQYLLLTQTIDAERSDCVRSEFREECTYCDLFKQYCKKHQTELNMDYSKYDGDEMSEEALRGSRCFFDKSRHINEHGENIGDIVAHKL